MVEEIVRLISDKQHWVAELPSNWKTMRLKNVAVLRFSNVDKLTNDGEVPVLLCNYLDVYRNDYITSEIEFMKASASIEEIRKFKLEKGDVLVTKDSETANDIAVPALVEFEADNLICGYHLAQIKPDKNILSGEYLFHLFQSKQINSHFEIRATGVTRYGLSIDSFASVLLPIPPVEEQHTIVTYIKGQSEKINRFIQKKQRFIELLNEQRQRIISHAVTKGVNPNVQMKPTGIDWLGDIPKHWELLRTKNIFNLITEAAPIGNNEELLSVYTEIGVKPRKELEERGNKSQTTDNYWRVKIGDIIVNKLLAWMGAIGISEYDGVTSPAYDILRIKTTGNPYYYHELFRNTSIKDEFKKHSRGVLDMRLRLYFSEFGKIFLPVMPIAEQNQILTHIKNETQTIDIAVSKTEKEIELMKEYREAMIAEAVMGK